MVAYAEQEYPWVAVRPLGIKVLDDRQCLLGIHQRLLTPLKLQTRSYKRYRCFVMRLINPQASAYTTSPRI